MAQIHSLMLALEDKERLEEIILEIEKLQREQGFNLKTELQTGQTIKAAIEQALGKNPVAKRLIEIFSGGESPTSRDKP